MRTDLLTIEIAKKVIEKNLFFELFQKGLIEERQYNNIITIINKEIAKLKNNNSSDNKNDESLSIDILL